MKNFAHNLKVLFFISIALLSLILWEQYYKGISKNGSNRSKREIVYEPVPPEVSNAWVIYIQRRLAEEIQRSGQNLRVRTTYIGADPTYSYVSINTPYNVDCNGFDIGYSVEFGAEISANITGHFSVDYKNEPPAFRSENLTLQLCGIISQWMGRITSPRIN